MKVVHFVLLGMFLILVVSIEMASAKNIIIPNTCSSVSCIQGKITGASSGDVIKFPAKTHSDLRLNITKPLTLVSNTGDYRTSGVVINGSVSWLIKSDNVTIKGFKFENITPPSSSSGWGDRAVIRVWDGNSNLIIEKNKFTNIKEGTLAQYSGAGINLVRAGTNKNVSIKDNLYENSSGPFVYSIRIPSPPHNNFIDSVIENNIVRNVTSRSGLWIERGSNISILNNTINNTKDSGIFLANIVDVYVRSNVIENADFSPHDDETYSRHGGISFGGGTTVVVIENNTITGSHDGILLCTRCGSGLTGAQENEDDVINSTVRYNVIHSNTGKVDLYNYDRNPVSQASHNYWGSPDGPNLSRLSGRRSGDVVYLPFYADESLTSLLSSIDLVADVLDSRPENTSEVPSSKEVYRYLEINNSISGSFYPSGIRSLVDGANIVFKVPRSWLDLHDFQEDDVVLLGYDDGDWTDLDTSVVNESSDSGMVTFSAKSHGSSTFAITGKIPPPTTDDDDDDDAGRGGRGSSGRKLPENETRNGTADNETIAPAPEKNETDKEKTTPPVTPPAVPSPVEGGFSLPWYLWVLAVAVVLGIAVVVIRSLNKKRND